MNTYKTKFYNFIKKTALLFLFIFIFSLFPFFLFSQGVAVNTTGTDPHSSSILDVSSTKFGVLIPRMNEVNRDAIQNPAEALMIFNTTLNCYEIYVNNQWQKIWCAACPIPEQPGNINGLSAQTCNATAQVYSISPVPNATSYTWTVPTGWAITSGQGTASIAVTTGALGQNGTITVYASNICGNSDLQSLNVTTQTPLLGPIIAAIPFPCIVGTQIISVAPVPNATTYTWTIPSAWTLNSGQGTNQINVTISASGVNEIVTVAATNSCGTGITSTLNVTRDIPVITGINGPAGFVCPGSTQTFSCNVISGATYNWSVYSDWTILSGQGTNAITVLVGGTCQDNWTISVTASNTCGSVTASRNFSSGSWYYEIPLAFHNISCGTGFICENSIGAITADFPVGCAPTFWNIGGATILSGQNTDSVVIQTDSWTYCDGLPNPNLKQVYLGYTNECGCVSAIQTNYTIQNGNHVPVALGGYVVNSTSILFHCEEFATNDPCGNNGEFYWYHDVSTDPSFSTFVGIYHDYEAGSPAFWAHGLSPNTTYYHRARTVNKACCSFSNYSNVVSVTTLP